MNAGLPFLDLASPGFSTRSSEVNSARVQGWCARTPYGLAVLRHREAGQLLRDRRLRQGSHAWPALTGLTGSFADFWTRSIIGQEGEAHRSLRQLAVPALSQEFISGLQPDFDRIACALANGLQPRCEFMEVFAIPFAGQAICILLGLPPSDWRRIAHDAYDLGLAMGVEAKQHEARVNAACDRLFLLADELIASAREHGKPQSYVTRLVSRFDAAELEPQALRDLVVISIFGGVDTTAAQLGLLMALFAEHPEQWRVLRADPGLIPNAIDEGLRCRPTTTWVTREAVEDFETGGVRIARGETLHILVHATARDPAVCADPHFDITAPRKLHFGFGGGAHHCLGHLVARTDITSALRALSARIEGITLDGTPDWLPESGNTGPLRLPLYLGLSDRASD